QPWLRLPTGPRSARCLDAVPVIAEGSSLAASAGFARLCTCKSGAEGAAPVIIRQTKPALAISVVVARLGTGAIAEENTPALVTARPRAGGHTGAAVAALAA